MNLETIMREIVYLVLPPDIFLIAIVVLIPFCARPRTRSWLVSLTVVVAVMSIPALAKLSQWPLKQVPNKKIAGELLAADYDVVVVLGGGIYSDDNGGFWLSTESSRRGALAKKVALSLDLPLIVSGGNPNSDFPSESEVMRRQLAMPPDTVLESSSLNTYQNAVNSAVILNEKGWERVLLVTSETHLLRSYAVFSAQGISVSGMLSVKGKKEIGVSDFLPASGSFAVWRQTLKEYLGLSWYLVSGKIGFNHLS